jgi:hypothetical protein
MTDGTTWSRVGRARPVGLGSQRQLRRVAWLGLGRRCWWRELGGPGCAGGTGGEVWVGVGGGKVWE